MRLNRLNSANIGNYFVKNADTNASYGREYIVVSLNTLPNLPANLEPSVKLFASPFGCSISFRLPPPFGVFALPAHNSSALCVLPHLVLSTPRRWGFYLCVALAIKGTFVGGVLTPHLRTSWTYALTAQEAPTRKLTAHQGDRMGETTFITAETLSSMGNRLQPLILLGQEACSSHHPHGEGIFVADPIPPTRPAVTLSTCRTALMLSNLLPSSGRTDRFRQNVLVNN